MSEIPITFDERVNQFDGMTRDESGSLHRADVAPGAAWWVNGMDDQVCTLRFVCPCGCGVLGAAPIKPGYGNGYWTWNGHQARPTLQPSILFSSGCPNKWHGYLTEGVWKSC